MGTVLDAPPYCEKCPRLAQSRRRVVNGSGPLPADVLIVAAKTNRQDEISGHPLSSWGGQRLPRLLELAGLGQASVRVENLVRCRPPAVGNKDSKPLAQEIRNCGEYLARLIQDCQPKIIIALGAASQWFFPGAKLSEIHGQVRDWTNAFHDKRSLIGVSGSGDTAGAAAPVEDLDADRSGGLLVGNASGGISPASGLPAGSGGNQRFRVMCSYDPDVAQPRLQPELAEVIIQDFKNLADANHDQRLGQYTLVTGPELAEMLRLVNRFAFDVETTGNDWQGTFQPRRASIIGYSVCVHPGVAYYTTDHIDHLAPWLEDPGVEIVCWNAKYEIEVCLNYGVHITNYRDPKLAAYLLRRPSTNLKDCSWHDLGITQTRFDEVDWSDLEQVTQYGAADADLTLRLANLYDRWLRRDGLWFLYEDIELPVVEVLAEMERLGVAIDPRPLAQLQEELTIQREALDSQIAGWFPELVNWRSPRQKANALYGPPYWRVRPGASLRGRLLKEFQEERIPTGAGQKLEFIPPGLGLIDPSGQLKTDMLTLHDLQHPCVELLIARSSIDKMEAAFLNRIPVLVQEDGRLHPTYSQAGSFEEVSNGEAPGTGRLSCSSPNAQQIPNHGDDSRPYMVEWGKRVRRAFVAEPGRVLVKADLGQVEPRLAAYLSGDERMQYELAQGDLYIATAAVLYGSEASAINREQRQIGKRCFMSWLNRGRIKGIQRSAWWLSDAAASAVCQGIDQLYPRYTEWCREVLLEAQKTGYVHTRFARRRFLPHLWTGDREDISKAERVAIPTAIQGTAADVLKIILSRLSAAFAALPGYAAVVLTVHDEVVTECETKVLPQVLTEIFRVTDNLLPVALPIEAQVGLNWADGIEVVGPASWWR